MLRPVARAVQPPDVTRRSLVVERVQHREHRRDAHPGAHEHDRARGVVERERAAWGTDLEPVTDSHAGADVVTGRALHLDFDADPVVVCER